MNRFILIVTLIGSFYSLFGQNVTDSKGRKQGEWTKYHDNGKSVRYKGQFKDDLPYGKFIYYYETGEVQTILEYQTEGYATSKTYFTNGSLMAKGEYINQLKDGVWWYFSIDKMVIAKETYEHGKLNGISYKFFPTEIGAQPRVLEEINYVDGSAQGEWKQYYKDGKVQVKGHYKDGEQQGECIWYTPAGKGEVIGYFKEGLKTGMWRFLDEDGEYTVKYFLNDKELTGKALENYLNYQKTVGSNE